MDACKINRYNKIALSTVYSEPEEGNFHTELIPKMVEQFFKPLNLPVEAIILDIGCGQGTFMDEVAKLDYPNRIGITKSGEDFDACNAKGHTTTHCDMSDLPFNSEEIDFIWCRHALEHSPFPFFTLLEFNRILKDGGKVYVEVPAPDCVRKHEWNPNHYSVLGPEMWAALFVKAGFKVLQSVYFDLELQMPEGKVPERNICFVIEKHDTIA